MNKIAVVIVTFNRKVLLRKCLDALLAQKLLPNTIFIIDNNSTDNTYEFLKENDYFDNNMIQYTKLNENIGGAGGFNYGIELAYNNGYDWIWIMDDDVSPAKDCLLNLINFSSKADDLILIPLRVAEINNKVTMVENCATLEYDIAGASTKMIKFKNTYNDISELPEFVDIKNMSFEGPLINRKIIEKIGLPYKEFFIFYDDTDYSFRALKYTNIKLITSAWLYRNNIIQSNTNAGWRDYYFIRNTIIFERRHSKNKYRCYVKPILNYLKFIIKSILKFRFSNFSIITKAYFDGYFSRTGKTIDPMNYKYK